MHNQDFFSSFFTFGPRIGMSHKIRHEGKFFFPFRVPESMCVYLGDLEPDVAEL